MTTINVSILVDSIKVVVVGVSSLQYLGTILAGVILANMEVFALNVLLYITGLTDVQTVQALPPSCPQIGHFRFNKGLKF